MFNHLPGRIEAKIEQMEQEVSRTHDIRTMTYCSETAIRQSGALTSDLRWVSGLSGGEEPSTDCLKEVKINDGLHFNVVALIPYPCILSPEDEPAPPGGEAISSSDAFGRALCPKCSFLSNG